MKIPQILTITAYLLPICAGDDTDIDVAGTTVLKNSNAFAIKNKVLQDNVAALYGNAIYKQQNDVYMLDELAEQLPVGVDLLINDRDPLIVPTEDVEEIQRMAADQEIDGADDFAGGRYRTRFRYHSPRHGLMYGYRYPLWYWRRYGPRYYPGVCGFDRIYGTYYYC